MIPWPSVFSFYEALLLVCGAVILYGFCLRRLAEFAHPYRLKLAEIGEKYLAVCDDFEEKTEILFYLDNATNPWFLISASMLFPILLVWILIRSGNLERKHKDDTTYLKIIENFNISVFSANPLFGTIVILELVVFALISILIAGNIVKIRRAIMLLLQQKAGRHATAHSPS